MPFASPVLLRYVGRPDLRVTRGASRRVWRLTRDPQIVPACKPYTITWDADTPNKVSILLLRGPSTDIKPLGAPLVEGLDNTGTFTWTPAADLEADVTHYGLQIIDDVNGQYQCKKPEYQSPENDGWLTQCPDSDQFGISKDSSCVGGSSSASASASATPTASASASASATAYPTSSSVVVTSSTPYVTPTYTASTGFPQNSTLIAPTGTLTVPSSLLTSATGSATTTGPIQQTGAAVHVQAGLGLAGALAGLIMMV